MHNAMCICVCMYVHMCTFGSSCIFMWERVFYERRRVHLIVCHGFNVGKHLDAELFRQ